MLWSLAGLCTGISRKLSYLRDGCSSCPPFDWMPWCIRGAHPLRTYILQHKNWTAYKILHLSGHFTPCHGSTLRRIALPMPRPGFIADYTVRCQHALARQVSSEHMARTYVESHGSTANDAAVNTSVAATFPAELTYGSTLSIQKLPR